MGSKDGRPGYCAVTAGDGPGVAPTQVGCVEETASRPPLPQAEPWSRVASCPEEFRHARVRRATMGKPAATRGRLSIELAFPA
jgi:hypothetical protein